MKRAYKANTKACILHKKWCLIMVDGSKDLIKSVMFTLPDNLRDRSISIKVILTVCNLENMLDKLIQVNGDFT